MPVMQDSTPSYLGHAFWEQHNVILMSGAVSFAVASASWLPLAAGSLCELAWLAIAPRLPAFKSRVDRRANELRKSRLDLVMVSALGKLDAPAAQRLRVVRHALDDILDQAAESPVAREVLDAAAARCEKLCRTFLDLMATRQHLMRAVADTPRRELEHELARLNQQFSMQKDIEIRIGLRQAIVSTQKKMGRAVELSQLSVALDAKLETIEKSAAHLKLRSRALASAGQLGQELDALLVDVGAAGSLEVPLRDAASGT